MQDAKKSPKSRHLHTIVQLCRAISSQLRHVSTIGKNLLSSNICSRCPHNMVSFGLLVAEIDPVVWGTPANFNRFRVLAVLLHGSRVVSVSQTLRRWTEGATYIRQGDRHVGHWPTFLVSFCFVFSRILKLVIFISILYSVMYCFQFWYEFKTCEFCVYKLAYFFTKLRTFSI